MWSSWFPNGIFRARGRSQNLQDRINGLYEAKVTPKDCSPTLKELQKRRNLVRKMSTVYEENLAIYNESANVTLRKASNKTSLSPKFVKVVEPEEEHESPSSPLAEHNQSNIQKLIQSILDKDLEYIKKMELLIKTYVREFENIPALRLKDEITITDRQKGELFGPIEKIHKFHLETFHPMILSCGDDVGLFAESISVLCTKQRFISYLIYAMDEKESEYRRNVYYKFFVNGIMEKTGIAYDFAPIQMLEEFHIILINIYRELQSSHVSAEVISAMAKAENDWKYMMEQLFIMRNLSKGNSA